MTDTAEEILRSHGLRRTLGRIQVLHFVMQQKAAVSHSELSQAFEGKLDRASLYRTLQDFEQQGLIHKVPDDVVSVKYAYCHGSCSPEHHHDSHLHFKCHNCDQTYCLEENTLPKIAVPEGFIPESTEVLIHGICRACA
ncbi:MULTISPECIES: Fur family transcriptional regulator [Croceimicrobium]|uniref:Transcriptional repressor n=1 Tax=Croceimicrobium hydrocarbonivorans TaxID=2761580 RepID=A0A7H0VJI9_9FLAO|nr:transcriptional repressor [Croceimicrobium hydrocarbonivorans]QNR25887.1 transcriptional repressor [Croceimicrobium hydrocarbonivorans]